MNSLKRIGIVVGLFALFLLILTIGIHTALSNNALGFDYIFTWHAGRALFIDGINPYSPEIALRTQISLYGRPAMPGENCFPFFYPLPILFATLPLYFLSYDWSQAAWMAVNLLVPLAVGLLLFTRAPKWLALTLPLFYQMSFTWIIGNYALLFGMIFIVVFYTLFYVKNPPVWADFLCGVALAWVTNKPQMVWLYMGLALIVALRGRRWKMLAGFAAGMAGSHLIALAVLPDWPVQWLIAARRYPQQTTHVPSLVTYLDYLLPTAAAWTVGVILALLFAAVTVWLIRRWWQGRLAALLLLAWCGLFTSLVDLSALTPDQIVLLVPVFLWAVQQRPTGTLKVGWFAAILLTYLLFFLDIARVIPTAVDRGPLLIYIAWLAAVWWRKPVPQTGVVQAGVS